MDIYPRILELSLARRWKSFLVVNRDTALILGRHCRLGLERPSCNDVTGVLGGGGRGWARPLEWLGPLKVWWQCVRWR